MLETIIKVYPKNAPWMSVKLKELIRMRQITFHSSNHGPVFNFYRNTANRESKRCKGMNYASKVQDLKGVNPRRWWNEIHNLCLSKKQSSSLFSSLKVPASPPEIANAISDALLDSLQSYKPMDCDPTVTLLPLEENPDFQEVSVQRVYNNLKHLNKQKAPGPDGLSNWVLKEYVEVLAQPVCDTSNTLYKEQKLPSVWKLADVTPLPKVKRVTDPKKLLRLISLTPSALSKIAEDLLSQTL